jgi:hypothetical protein
MHCALGLFVGFVILDEGNARHVPGLCKSAKKSAGGELLGTLLYVA